MAHDTTLNTILNLKQKKNAGGVAGMETRPVMGDHHEKHGKKECGCYADLSLCLLL